VVFVLDRYKRPLMPCSEKRARLLLERGRARVHRLYPFTIRLIDRVVQDSDVQPVGRVAEGIHWRCCRVVQRFDGYSYGKEDAASFSPRLKPGASGAAKGR
jgi:hypothetical protein